MIDQHKDLAAGRWSKLSFIEQMANIGSEVERALNWRGKQNTDYSQRAFGRVLQLIDLTLNNTKGFSRRKELARVRESLIDYFSGTNEFKSDDSSWKKYFLSFAYAARRNT